MSRPVLIGLAGGSCSGKSTLAKALVEQLPARGLRIEHDRYYRSLPPGIAPIDHNWDEPAALDTPQLVQHLDQLVEGKAVDLPVYCFKRHSRQAHSHRVEPRPLLIVEGILSLADEGLRRRYSHRVFVEAPAELRLRRRIERDQEDRGWTEERIVELFHRSVQPMHRRWVQPTRQHADLVVDGTRPVEQLVQRLRSWLEL